MEKQHTHTSRTLWGVALAAVLMTSLMLGGQAQAAPQHTVTCSTCHSMPPDDSADGTRDPETGAVPGNHRQHAAGAADTCAKCHGDGVLSYTTGHRNKDRSITIRANINQSPAGGAYARSGNPAFVNQTSLPPLGSCSSVNCHFESTTPQWGSVGGVTCNTCHSDLPTSKSHKPHTDIYGGKNSCATCHGEHGTFSHATSAGRRAISVVGSGYSGNNDKYLPSQSAERVAGSCATASCHENPYGAGYIASPTWGTNAACSACHKDGGAFDGTTGAPATGSHGIHLANSNVSCGQCHDAAVKNSFGGSGHINSTIDVMNGYPQGVAKHAAGSGYTSCSAAACHSNPYGSGMVATPVWGTASGCAACHNGDGAFDGTTGAPATGSHAAHMGLYNSACNLCHDGAAKNSTGGISHANGTVDVMNDYVGAPLAKHDAGTYTGYCASASCHASPYGAGAVNSPVWGSTTGCASCHTGDGAFDATTGAPATGSHAKHMALSNVACSQCHDGAVKLSSGGTNHSNGNVDVTNGYPTTVPRHPIGTYNGSCSTSACHTDGSSATAYVTTPKWGRSMPADCSGCHGGIAEAAKPMTKGRHTAHMNNYSTLGRGNNLACSECHAKTVTGSATLITGGAHLNTLKDYSGSKAGSFAVDTCSTAYCHSSGQAVPVFRSMTGSKVWIGGTARLDCSGCHGNAAGASWKTDFGAPNYPNSAETPNSHQKHIIANNATDSRTCARCHTATVDAGVAGKLRDYSTAHLNRTRDVAFRFAFAGYSENFKAETMNCTTYCHSNVQAPGGNGPATVYGSPAWGQNGTTTCHSCHKDMSTLEESAENLQLGSHRRHAVSFINATSGHSGAGYSCALCHGAGYTPTTYNPASHTDGTINLSFTGKAATTTYSQAADNEPGNGYGSCSTSKCHGRATRNWGLNTDAPTCEKCHGSARTAQESGAFADTAGNSTSKYAGTHASHLAGSHGISNPITCDQCHTVPTSITSFGHMSSLPAKNSWGSLATHSASYPGMDKTDVQPALVPSYSGAPGRTCSNTYCHAGVLNNSKQPSGSDPTPAWGVSGYFGCGKCHGYPPELPHIQNNNCSGCHGHVDQSNIAFVQDGPILEPFGKIDKRLHINGQVDVTIDDCLGCHSSSGCTPAPGQTSCIDRGLIGAHSAHTDAELFLKKSDGTNRKLSGGDFIDSSWIYDIKYVKGFPKYACGTCHDMRDSGLHKNMSIDVDFDPAHSLTGTVKNKNKAGGPWIASRVTGVSVTCKNVYCHSNGYIDKETQSYDYHVTPDWYSTSPWAGLDKCAQCHGNSPNTGGKPGSGAHAKHVVGNHYKGVFSGYSGKMPAAGGVGTGSVHGDPNTSTTFNCYICHFDTVKAKYNDLGSTCSSCHTPSQPGTTKGTMDVYSSNSVHVDGRVDVVFFDSFTTLKSRAQLRNNITDVDTVGMSWKRVKGYKTYSSYDQARIKPVYVQGTCSTTACHNNTTMEWRTQGPLNCAACHNGLPH